MIFELCYETDSPELDIKRQLIANVKKKPEGVIKIIKASKLKPSLNLMHTIGG